MMTPLRFEQLIRTNGRSWRSPSGGRHADDSEARRRRRRPAGRASRCCTGAPASTSRWPGARLSRLHRRPPRADHRGSAPADLPASRVGIGALRQRARLRVSRSAVRAHARYVAVAAAVFVLPTLIVGLLVYWRPELILSVVSAETAARSRRCIRRRASRSGARARADTDWIDVRLLHPQQHRRLVPVLRRRAVRGYRQPVLPGLQRRVRRRAWPAISRSAACRRRSIHSSSRIRRSS